MDIFRKCGEYRLADDIKAAGYYPYFHALESRQDKEVVMEGKRRIMLGSNNYLGLTTHPKSSRRASRPTSSTARAAPAPAF